VQIAPTEVGIDQQRRLEEGRTTRGLGEAAALETLERVLSADTEAEALLLFEDSNIMRRRMIVDERVDLISTGDFLRELEAAHLPRRGAWTAPRGRTEPGSFTGSVGLPREGLRH
jgi:hypothetical protein